MDKLRQHLPLLFVAVLLFASLIPAILVAHAGAYGLVTSRFIEMSSSANAATDVTYSVGFTTATTHNVGGIVINFCSNSPIIGDSCTAPASFDSNFANLALANQAGITGFGVDTTNSTANTVILTKGSATSINSSTAVTFDLGSTGASDGITNPATTNTTFYARILTYDTAANAQAYVATNSGGGTGVVDAGGVALSTAAQITITSKVQERLTFCVYTGVNCAAGGSAVTLGDANGVLDPAGPYVDKNTQYDVATNASQGVIIRIKGDTLKSGSFDVSAAGASAVASAPGTEQFGFCNYQTTGSGLTPTAPYNDTNCNTTTQSAGTGTPGGTGTANFAFDTNNTTGTTSTYGQDFAHKTAGATSSGVLAFLGNISNTTEAGIYTTTLTFIATGTY